MPLQCTRQPTTLQSISSAADVMSPRPQGMDISQICVHNEESLLYLENGDCICRDCGTVTEERHCFGAAATDGTSPLLDEDENFSQKNKVEKILFQLFWDALCSIHCENANICFAAVEQSRFVSQCLGVPLDKMTAKSCYKGHLAIILRSAMHSYEYFRSYDSVATIMDVSRRAMMAAEKEQNMFHANDYLPFMTPARAVPSVCAWLNLSFMFEQTALRLCLALQDEFSGDVEVFLCSLLELMIYFLPLHSPDKNKIDLAKGSPELRELFRHNSWIKKPTLDLPYDKVFACMSSMGLMSF